MDNFDAVRTLAREKHRAMVAKGANRSAASLLAHARIDTGLAVRRVPPAFPILGGGAGALHRSSKAIYVSNELGPEMAAFVEAHEFGHFWIETPSDPVVVSRETDPGAPETPTPLGLKRVEAYSPQELRERHANVFGREFLLPIDEARRLFITEGKNAPEIASSLGIPLRLVHQQLATALLLPDRPTTSKDAGAARRPSLDDSQRDAAEHRGSPLLVEAGPGTGKTRTMIARIEHLIGVRKVPPPSILALTYSNRAANEIRERIAAVMPDAAAEIWAGTFHSFGLEILRKWGERIGIRLPVQLLDQADVLAMLEADLPRLGLDHYLRLYDPLQDLGEILGAIGRVKDEMRTPADYAAAAARMKIAGQPEKDRIAAEKAAEVAGVFEHYDARMRADGRVDFTDLISRSVELLRAHPDARDELRGQYQHVLVDEYQDVNRASAFLLKELVGSGERLWVVGDARQSIYRFIGAAPINVQNFEKDYPGGSRKPLTVNYRSRQQIVDAFGTYASEIQIDGRPPTKLTAKRGAGLNAVDYNVASLGDAEVAGIATAIERHKSAGIPYRNQAVLSRTHANLQRIAFGLEALGIPVLYLGDLFERPEVKDLLSVLSFVSEPHRGGLYRVAHLAPFRMPLADVRKFLHEAEIRGVPPFGALRQASGTDGLSARGRLALGALGTVLSGTEYMTSPGTLLCRVLFDHGTLLRTYLAGDDAKAKQQRVAIYQLLQFAIENDRGGAGDPKRHLLGWIRRLEELGDETALREVPPAVDGIDAVRLMTVHGSKGLEFSVVHLPTLGNGMFPKSWSGSIAPVPRELLPADAKEESAEEEKCLFYVALSRARDHLSLSRFARDKPDTKNQSHPTPALKAIAVHLPRAVDSAPTWTGTLPPGIAIGPRPDLAVSAREHDGHDIDLMLKCPRRYLFQVGLGLSGSRDDTGYVRFHRTVYQVIRWMAEQGAQIDREAATAEFERAWSTIGPHDSPLAELYRDAAVRALDKALARPRKGIRFNEEIVFEIDGHRISMRVDEIEAGGGTNVVRRVRTGRAPSTVASLQSHLHAMMLMAGRQSLGGLVRFETHFLGSDDSVAVQLDGVMANRQQDVREELGNLAAGVFPNAPKVKTDCPRCPHYFICPTVPEES